MVLLGIAPVCASLVSLLGWGGNKGIKKINPMLFCGISRYREAWRLCRSFAVVSGIIFMVVFGVSGDLLAQTAKSVRLISDDWCPYTCADTRQQQGIFVDISRTVLAQTGLASSYENFAWQRATRSVEIGKYDVLLGADRQHSRKLLLFKDFYLFDETVFAVRRGSGIRIEKPADLNRYIIGYIGGYTYDDDGLWEDAIHQAPRNLALRSDHGEPALLDLLMSDRLDVAVVNIDVASHYLGKSGQQGDIRFIRPGIGSRLYVAFTRNGRGKALHRSFAKGLSAPDMPALLAQICEAYDFRSSIVIVRDGPEGRQGETPSGGLSGQGCVREVSRP